MSDSVVGQANLDRAGRAFEELRRDPPNSGKALPGIEWGPICQNKAIAQPGRDGLQRGE